MGWMVGGLFFKYPGWLCLRVPCEDEEGWLGSRRAQLVIGSARSTVRDLNTALQVWVKEFTRCSTRIRSVHLLVPSIGLMWANLLGKRGKPGQAELPPKQKPQVPLVWRYQVPALPVSSTCWNKSHCSLCPRSALREASGCRAAASQCPAIYRWGPLWPHRDVRLAPGFGGGVCV